VAGVIFISLQYQDTSFYSVPKINVTIPNSNLKLQEVVVHVRNIVIVCLIHKLYTTSGSLCSIELNNRRIGSGKLGEIGEEAL
jgi:hypothetical protein